MEPIDIDLESILVQQLESNTSSEKLMVIPTEQLVDMVKQAEQSQSSQTSLVSNDSPFTHAPKKRGCRQSPRKTPLKEDEL